MKSDFTPQIDTDARTIGDLAGEERITLAHIAVALQYRPRPSLV